jgi:predicted nucleic acid-binding protein
LHAGELEAITLARHLGAQLLIDEHLGREAAREQGVDVVGSLTVLAEAKRLGLLDEAGPVLTEMMHSGYWIDDDLASAFLAEVGES